MSKNDNKYIRKLEETISKFMAPLKGIPFSIAVKCVYGHKVISFDKSSNQHQELLHLLSQAAEMAGKQAQSTGIPAKRANEVGNYIEPFIKKALSSVGLSANTPRTPNGVRQAAGYPDIEIIDKYGNISYLECKTYNIENIGTTQRAFYFSPPTGQGKITCDALHLLMSFQIEVAGRKGNQNIYQPVHWRIYSLESMAVDVKHEFNASNKEMYKDDALLAEGPLV